MTVLGNLALWLALLVGVWGALAGFVGGRQARPDLAHSARRAVFAMCGALLVAVFALEWALFQHDFNVEYVAAYTSRNLPIFYTWSALYAGQKGSLLFWATVLSVFGSLALVLTPRRHAELLPTVAGVVALVASFFISVMLFGHANPFQRLPYTPLDGSGMLRKWNLALIIGSWLLSIFGTFITRSGVISSVHSFTQSSVGYFFLAFLVVAAAASFTLYAIRLPLLTAETQLESMVSREASFLFNNLLLIGIAFSVLWGTLFPILSELVQGTKVTVGPPFFNQVNVPLGLALLALTGIGPLIAWRRASLPNLQRQFAVPATAGGFTLLVLLVGGMRDLYALLAIALGGFVAATIVQEFARGTRARHRQYGEAYPLALGRLLGRNRRRYGGYIVHTGIVILFVAFAGMVFKTETEATLRPGESVSLRSPYGHTYTLTHLGISQYDALNRQITAATVEVRRNGKPIGFLTPEKRQHVDGLGRPTFQPSTEPAIMSMLREDLYGVLGGTVAGTEQAVFRFTINPLVWWVWYGGMIVAVGGLIVMWPGGSPAARRSQAGYAVRLVGTEEKA